jgi:hypothetical protein
MLPESAVPSFMGYSVGRWDGDTLVVESSGFNDRTWLDCGGTPHTESLREGFRYQRARRFPVRREGSTSTSTSPLGAASFREQYFDRVRSRGIDGSE